MSKEPRRTPRYDKEKRNQIKFKRHTNWHHVYPTSRFKLKKDPALHEAWHDIFGNMSPEEAMEKVEEWMGQYNKFRKEILDHERKSKAWKMLFGEAKFSEVISIIQKDWTFPGVKMIKI